MSIKSGFDNLMKSASVNGVELAIQSDGKYLFHLVNLKKEKSTIVIEQQVVGVNTITDLKEKIDVKIPLIISITGKGIINKKTDAAPIDSNKILLNKILPNANEAEFCIQKTLIDDKTIFVSVIRNSLLDEILNEFKTIGIDSIQECYLGPFAINNCLPIIDEKINNIQLKNYKLGVKNGLIQDLNQDDTFTAENVITIGDDTIQLEQLISFATAFSHFRNSLNSGIVNSTLLEELKSDFKEKRKFVSRTWGMLLSFFFILLINYFVFNNYWTKNNEISSRLEINKSSLNRLDTLKNELQQKKVFMQQNGLMENSLTSFYADKLAESLPNSISWTSLEIHPVKKKEANAENDLVQFENKIIRISGNCQYSLDLNDWMKHLKNFLWIDKLELLNYKQENANDKGAFLLEIQLK